MIAAEILADSVNPKGCRITTMKVTMPRIVLAEFNTHRMFSRNSASSRAIPFKKMAESVRKTPFIPIAFQKEHTGMQGTEYFEDEVDIMKATAKWLQAKSNAMYQAVELNELGVTKQLCNRLLEPFMYHTVIVTSTDWGNFFHLRCPQYIVCEGTRVEEIFRSKKDLLKKYPTGVCKNYSILDWLKFNKGQGEIHIMAVAEAMWDALIESTPKELNKGEWHIPFGDNINLPSPIPIPAGLTLDEGVALQKIKVATARCARVSYTIMGEEKVSDYDSDIKLHDRLVSSGHFSPTEHIAQCTNKSKRYYGNFRGWKQYRKTIRNENKW